MKTIRSRWQMIAVAMMGLACAGPVARGSDADLAREVQALERVGGFVTPGGLLLPDGVVAGVKGTTATDADMVHFRYFQGIRVLGLDGTRISDAGLVNLKDLPHLSVLSLKETRVVGLAPLAGLKSLRALDVSGTRVNDASLANLKTIRSLREIDLARTQITDAGIVHLAEMKHLRKLDIAGTRISPEGVRKLRRSLWWCRIETR